MINQKMKKMGSTGSAIRELFEYGNRRKKEIGVDNVYDFSIGNPSVEAPSIVNETLIDLLKNENSLKLHSYTTAAGQIEVRDSIAKYLNSTYGCNEVGSLIYLTTGAAAGLTISFHALLEKDDEAIVFTPYFSEYRVFVEKAEGKIIEVQPDEDLLPNMQDFETKITAKTKVVILNSPCNPTGVLFKEETIKQIANIMKKKEIEYGHEIYLLSDEPYRELIYSEEKYPFVTNYYDNSLVVYSFSKSLSLPGERIGYILVSNGCKSKEDVYAAIKGAGRTMGFVCATSLFQPLIPKCLGVTSDLSVYKKNRDILYEGLSMIGYEAVYPEGAFYLFVKALENDAKKFSEVAKQYELLLVPSDSFGVEGYVRISYCVSQKTIENALPAFEKLFKHYKKD